MANKKAKKKLLQQAGEVLYNKFSFNNIVYNVGEFALFRESQKSTIVGRILRILEKGGSKEVPN